MNFPMQPNPNTYHEHFGLPGNNAIFTLLKRAWAHSTSAPLGPLWSHNSPLYISKLVIYAKKTRDYSKKTNSWTPRPGLGSEWSLFSAYICYL